MIIAVLSLAIFTVSFSVWIYKDEQALNEYADRYKMLTSQNQDLRDALRDLKDKSQSSAEQFLQLDLVKEKQLDALNEQIRIMTDRLNITQHNMKVLKKYYPVDPMNPPHKLKKKK